MNAVVEAFLKRIQEDPTIPVGGLPWLMSEAEWEYFKESPESFRKKDDDAEQLRMVEQEREW